MTLPFELNKNHKKWMKDNWRYKYKMKFTDEDFELFIYPEYIKATHCDLCYSEFKTVRDRELDHNHNTGEIRNILCRSCNERKKDKKPQKNNKLGEKYISPKYNKKYKNGIIYVFSVNKKQIKMSIELDYLIKFRDDWLKENNYET
jgi:hypothetical protein